MSRPSTIRDEDLLDAARTVFLTRGHGATTAEVASAAGVSEGLLFKRFGTKEGLFHAAMGTGALLAELMAAIEEDEPGRDVTAWLERVALRVLRLFRKVVPMAMMAWSTGGGPPPEMLGPNPPPLRVMRAMAGQLERRMREGWVTPHDPEIVARMLIGSLWHYVQMDLVMPKAVAPIPEETYVRGAVHVLWQGLAPRAGDAPRLPTFTSAASSSSSAPPRRRRS